MKEGLEILAERLIASARKEQSNHEPVEISKDGTYDRKINGSTTQVAFGRGRTPQNVPYRNINGAATGVGLGRSCVPEETPYRKINGTTTAVGFGRSCTPNEVPYILTDI